MVRRGTEFLCYCRHEHRWWWAPHSDPFVLCFDEKLRAAGYAKYGKGDRIVREVDGVAEEGAGECPLAIQGRKPVTLRGTLSAPEGEAGA